MKIKTIGTLAVETLLSVSLNTVQAEKKAATDKAPAKEAAGKQTDRRADRPTRESIIKRFDKDGDGKLSEAERAAARKAISSRGGRTTDRAPGRISEGLRERYQIAAKKIQEDLKDGKITEEQARERQQALRKRLAQSAGRGGDRDTDRSRSSRENLMKEFDKNKDGKLTPDELRPRFVADRNVKDGNRGIQNRSAVTQPLKPLPPVAKQIEGISTRMILKLFGAKGRHGGTESELANYRRVFGFSDTDKDGRHSKKEYIDDGAYLTSQSRRGIFQASDTNNDGYVTESEYIENRLITDEAKLIFSEIDANSNNRLTAMEFLASGKLKDRKLAKGVFKALDTNGDGELVIPEYLRVWGKWARH